MIKKFLSCALFATIPFFSSAYEPPTFIDFGNGSPDAYFLGSQAFNSAPELTPLFAYLKRTYHINTAVETGTFLGSTSILLSFIFDEVHTIELNPDFYQASKQNLKQFSNIMPYLGSSEEIMRNLLPGLKQQPILFYLDAHWNEFWPLRNELEEIRKTHQENCIIVIDDFKVPGREDIPYDAYGVHECSYEYIKDKLDEIFVGGYTLHFVIPKSVWSRAKLVVIPNQLKKN